MVAYSFNRRFYDSVSSLDKRHTIRADRKRHARPGEPVQLYAAMRTKHCRKLVDPDPICTSVHDVELYIGCGFSKPRLRKLVIDGRELSDLEIEEFAVADGFRAGVSFSARDAMGRFWTASHGTGPFAGVLIKWEAKAK